MLTQYQINKIIEECKQDSRVQGVLLTGSYVYGKPHNSSDLDVRCIISDDSPDWAEFERERFGTRIEVFFNPPDKVRYYMQQSKKEGHGDCIHFWANGKIVYDPNGIVDQLQQEAKQLWEDGSGSGNEWVWRKEKHKDHIKKDW